MPVQQDSISVRDNNDQRMLQWQPPNDSPHSSTFQAPKCKTHPCRQMRSSPHSQRAPVTNTHMHTGVQSETVYNPLEKAKWDTTTRATSKGSYTVLQ
jgi:hypothetical protein